MISAHATPKATNPLAILEAALRGSAASGDNAGATAQASSQPANFLALLMQLIPGTIVSPNTALPGTSAGCQIPTTNTPTDAKKKKEQDAALMMAASLLNIPVPATSKCGGTGQNTSSVNPNVSDITVAGLSGASDKPQALTTTLTGPANLPKGADPGVDVSLQVQSRLPCSLAANDAADLVSNPKSLAPALPAPIAEQSSSTQPQLDGGGETGLDRSADPAATVVMDSAGPALGSQNQKTPVNALGNSISSQVPSQSPPDRGTAVQTFDPTGSPNVSFLRDSTIHSVVTSAKGLKDSENITTSNVTKPSRPSENPSAASVSLPSALAGAGPAHAASSSIAAPKTSASSALADQIQTQVSVHLDQLKQSGRLDLRFDLHPPELGRVGLRLYLEDGRVNVRMTVQDNSVKRTVDQQLEPLRARLSALGVSVGQFDVRRDGNSPNQNQQRAPEPSAQTAQADENGPAKARKSYTPSLSPQTLVDLMA
jgi:flagellar hook-length control protein FliK